MSNQEIMTDEVAVSVELLPNGIKGSAKSRMIAAIDQLGGAVFENLKARIDRSTNKIKAVSDGEVSLIEHISKLGTQFVEADPETIERALNTHFRDVLAKQENKDKILLQAKSLIEQRPPIDDIGGEIRKEFLGKFSAHAELAYEDEVRSIFASLLASEIREPGQISSATLHLVSILDLATAKLIDRLLPYIMYHGHIYLEAMLEELSIPELTELEMIGFLSIEKQHTMKFEGERNIAIRQIKRNKGLVFESANSNPIDFKIAIVSAAGLALSKAIDAPFDVVAYANLFKKKFGSEVYLGDYSVEGTTSRVINMTKVLT